MRKPSRALHVIFYRLICQKEAKQSTEHYLKTASQGPGSRHLPSRGVDQLDQRLVRVHGARLLVWLLGIRENPFKIRVPVPKVATGGLHVQCISEAWASSNYNVATLAHYYHIPMGTKRGSERCTDDAQHSVA